MERSTHRAVFWSLLETLRSHALSPASAEQTTAGRGTRYTRRAPCPCFECIADTRIRRAGGVPSAGKAPRTLFRLINSILPLAHPPHANEQVARPRSLVLRCRCIGNLAPAIPPWAQHALSRGVSVPVSRLCRRRPPHNDPRCLCVRQSRLFSVDGATFR